MNAHVPMTLFLPVTSRTRARLEATIEALVALLDEIDGDDEREADYDDEQDAGDEPEIGFENEPSLGWVDCLDQTLPSRHGYPWDEEEG